MRLHPLPVELPTHPIAVFFGEDAYGARIDAIRLVKVVFAVCDLNHSLNVRVIYITALMKCGMSQKVDTLGVATMSYHI